MKELKLNKIYLRPIESYEVKTVTVSNDLVLHVTLGRITLPQTSHNANIFPLNESYIKKSNKSYVTNMYVSDDLILHVDNKINNTVMNSDTNETEDKNILKVSKIYLKRNLNEKVSYVNISDDLTLHVSYFRKIYNVITDFTFSNGILTAYFIPSYRINNTDLVTDLNLNNGVLNVQYGRFINRDSNLDNVISDVSLNNGILTLETVDNIKTGVY